MLKYAIKNKPNINPTDAIKYFIENLFISTFIDFQPQDVLSTAISKPCDSKYKALRLTINKKTANELRSELLDNNKRDIQTEFKERMFNLFISYNTE